MFQNKIQKINHKGYINKQVHSLVNNNNNKWDK